MGIHFDMEIGRKPKESYIDILPEMKVVCGEWLGRTISLTITIEIQISSLHIVTMNHSGLVGIQVGSRIQRNTTPIEFILARFPIFQLFKLG
jgi:hypothetical protein